MSKKDIFLKMSFQFVEAGFDLPWVDQDRPLQDLIIIYFIPSINFCNTFSKSVPYAFSFFSSYVTFIHSHT